MRLPYALVIALAGCGQAPIPPDISDLEVQLVWSADESSRSVEVRVRDPDLPCTGTERRLGHPFTSGARCVGASWELSIDGVLVETEPVTCVAAHDGLFGPVPKSCGGGTSGWVPLPEAPGPDIEIVAATELEETRFVIPGARATHTFVEEVPLRRSWESGAPSYEVEPAIARVDVELACERFTAFIGAAGGEPVRSGSVQALPDGSGCDPHRLELSPNLEVEGEYDVRVLATAVIGGATVAVPIEGTLTVSR